MSRLRCEMSMSLDGFIAGPNDDVEQGLGEGGERLHEWMVEQAAWRETHGMSGGEAGPDSDVAAEHFENIGAVLMGRRMFTLGEGPWGDEPPFHVPVFVVTHRPSETIVKKGGTSYTFVTDGLESALARAREAGNGKDVSLAGGADLVRQTLALGLLDELQLHVVPVLFGRGRPLFGDLGPRRVELECVRVIASPNVTHMKFRPRNG